MTSEFYVRSLFEGYSKGTMPRGKCEDDQNDRIPVAYDAATVPSKGEQQHAVKYLVFLILSSSWE